MSDKKKSVKPASLPTIITLTLPTPAAGGTLLERAAATLLIQRGDLAHIRQFTYEAVEDMTTAIKAAYIALGAVEAEPPVIPEAPRAVPSSAPKTKAKAEQQPASAEEPTIDIPLKKGVLAVKVSYLKIVAGETDAAAYRQATLIAGKLIDGQLWDGKTPIRIHDVYTTQRKLQHLAATELSLFKLDDFVQVGAAAEGDASPQAVESDGLDVADTALLSADLPANTNVQQPEANLDA